MSIIPLNIGSAPNDGNGQDLRSGGQVINANFSELDQRTSAAQSAAQGAQATADAAIPGTQKGQPNGVAALDGNGTVPASQLPSYVDDVLEFNSFATLPVTGETGKIYITIDTNNQYRWSGTQYVLLTASPGSTDAVPEGAVNKYWTLARTLGSVLTGLVTTNPAVVAATDTVLAAFGKLQRQITDLASSKATKGANSDITSITGLTTPLAIDQGGTGSTSGVPEMVGASASAAGTKGLVPAPTAGATRFLSSLGTWLAINASASWGTITGNISSQTDLQAALAAKQDVSSAALIPTNANFVNITAITTQYTLPAGGTWAWWTAPFNNNSGILAGPSTSGVSAGGTTIRAAQAGINYVGFAWRIS
ncbi:hypothetical protein KFF47_14145 [Pseudomonas fluorescens]|nr:hypothetical protein [Pseudomonas fluorescens]